MVELLAVIIILAIVVGITIPAVLTTTNKAKSKAFQTAADTLADWIDREYIIQANGMTDIQPLDASFKAQFVPNSYISATGTIASTKYVLVTEALIEAGGLKTSNINTHTAAINKTAGTVETSGSLTQANFISATAAIKKDFIPYSGISINSNTAKSCVRLVAKTGGDYDTDTATGKYEVVCGGSCQTTTVAAGNYCKRGVISCTMDGGAVSKCETFTAS